MFPCVRFLETQLGVLPTTPVDHQNNLALRVVYVDDNLLDEGADDLLLGAHVCSWRVPYGFEVARERQQGRGIDRRRRHGCPRGHPGLAFPQTGQGGIPPCLQLQRNQAVVGIDSLVATFCELDLVLELLSLQIECPAVFVDFLAFLRCGHDGSIHRQRLNRNEDLVPDDLVRAAGPRVMHGAIPCIWAPRRQAYLGLGIPRPP